MEFVGVDRLTLFVSFSVDKPLSNELSDKIVLSPVASREK